MTVSRDSLQRFHRGSLRRFRHVSIEFKMFGNTAVQGVGWWVMLAACLALALEWKGLNITHQYLLIIFAYYIIFPFKEKNIMNQYNL